LIFKLFTEFIVLVLVVITIIFEVSSIWKPVSIEARVQERAFLRTLLEVATVHVCDCIFIVINKVILFRTRSDNVEGWNNEVAGSSANRTSSIMVLGSLLIVGSTPATNAFQTESVITTFK
jgi:hypothetical protein